MRRPALLALLSFLLLFMQQEAQVHALSHMGAKLAHSHQAEAMEPHADAPCTECALLAAGGSLAHGTAQPPGPAACSLPHLRAATDSRVADAPAFFRSRAPPLLA